MAALKTLVVTIIILKLASKGLAFYYTVLFTGPPIYKQFIVSFIDDCSHPEMFLKISKN